MAADEATRIATEERVAAAIIELRRNRYNRALQRRLYMFGDRELTPVQVDILETVVVRSALKMSELAQALGVDASTVSRTIAPLLALGLLERRNDAADRRTTIIAPTVAGLALARRLRAGRRALMRAVHAHIPTERLAMFAELLEDYIAAVSVEGRAQAGELP